MHFIFVIEAFTTVHTHEWVSIGVDQLVDLQFVKCGKSFPTNITGEL